MNDGPGYGVRFSPSVSRWFSELRKETKERVDFDVFCQVLMARGEAALAKYRDLNGAGPVTQIYPMPDVCEVVADVGERSFSIFTYPVPAARLYFVPFVYPVVDEMLFGLNELLNGFIAAQVRREIESYLHESRQRDG